jgi:hypothetical protein
MYRQQEGELELELEEEEQGHRRDREEARAALQALRRTRAWVETLAELRRFQDIGAATLAPLPPEEGGELAAEVKIDYAKLGSPDGAWEGGSSAKSPQVLTGRKKERFSSVIHFH